MSTKGPERMLTCQSCDWEQYCDITKMFSLLQSHGMMKRERNPDPETVLELFTQCASSWPCPECQEGTLKVELYDSFDEEDWGEVKKVCCEACRTIIPNERIEIFPDTRLCVTCQEKVEMGETPEAIYCPSCGSRMQLRTSTRGRTSQYAYYCSNYPSCRTQVRS